MNNQEVEAKIKEYSGRWPNVTSFIDSHQKYFQSLKGDQILRYNVDYSDGDVIFALLQKGIYGILYVIDEDTHGYTFHKFSREGYKWGDNFHWIRRSGDDNGAYGVSNWDASSTTWGKGIGAIIMSFNQIGADEPEFMNWLDENPLEVK